MVEHRHEPDLQDEIALAWERRPEFELYDLKYDPHQMVNLAGLESYAAVQEKLHGLLMGELQSNNDPRLDNDAFDRPPYLVKKKR